MHSLFFPFTWQEAQINSVNMMMLSGQVRDINDVEFYRKALLGTGEDEDAENQAA